MRTMTCPNCGAEIAFADENVKSAQCKYCDSIFELDEHSGELRSVPADKKPQTQTEPQKENGDTKLSKLEKDKKICILVTFAGVALSLIPVSFFPYAGMMTMCAGLWGVLMVSIKIEELKSPVNPANEVDDKSGTEKKSNHRPARTSHPDEPQPSILLSLPIGLRASGQNFVEVQAMFEGTGFTNVSCEPLRDIFLRVKDKPGIVANVTIGGKTLPLNVWLGRNQKFPSDVPIVIHYHSFWMED